MNLKHALITCLFLLAVITAISGQRYPICNPPGRSAADPDIHFLFFVDITLEASLLSRILYLLKAITCEIPINKNIQLIIINYSDEQYNFHDSVTSGEISSHMNLVSNETVSETSTRCSRFERVLGRAPEPFMDHHNVQFMVPIVEDGSGCSMLKVFQSHFQNDPRKKNFYFNGILINSELTPENNQSIRMTIPDIMKAINPKRISLVASKNVSDVHESAPLVQSYASMIRDILLGNITHDWEERSTTPGPSTTSSESPTNTSSESSTTTASESPTSTSSESATTEDELGLFKFEGDDDDEARILELNSTAPEFNMTSESSSESPTSEATTTTILQKAEKRAAVFFENSTILASSTTTSSESSTTTSSTSESSTTTSSESQKNLTNIEYDPDVEQDTFELELSSGLLSQGDTANETLVLLDGTTPGKWTHLETDTMIYILLLFLLIWLFCLFLCLVWMFYCAKKKKAKLEEEAENRQPLLESGASSGASSEAPKKIPEASSKSTASDDEEEWKSIKPPTRTDVASHSETESLKPVAAKYDPVEVSEFEKNDEDFDEKPRHGYIPAKKTQDLQFD